MSQSAASAGSESRSGVPVTSRWIWETDSSMPRSANSGTRSLVENMPAVAISSRSRQR